MRKEQGSQNSPTPKFWKVELPPHVFHLLCSTTFGHQAEWSDKQRFRRVFPTHNSSAADPQNWFLFLFIFFIL